MLNRHVTEQLWYQETVWDTLREDHSELHMSKGDNVIRQQRIAIPYTAQFALVISVHFRFLTAQEKHLNNLLYANLSHNVVCNGRTSRNRIIDTTTQNNNT